MLAKFAWIVASPVFNNSPAFVGGATTENMKDAADFREHKKQMNMETIKVSNEVYLALSDELIEQIGRDEYFKTTIEIEKDGIMYELEASGMVYRKEVRCPEWTGEVISDVIPTWWELHTFDKEGNEIRNDGEFNKIREYIIDYGKLW